MQLIFVITPSSPDYRDIDYYLESSYYLGYLNEDH